MLEVFTREGITDAVCVVTRYFGGVLLGTGGLARAYTKGAKDALMAAGVSVERLWDRILVPCPYGLYERLRVETEKTGGVIEEADFGADVTLTVLTPEDVTAKYLELLTELTGGKIEGEKLDQVFRTVPAARFAEEAE
jgi:putative IMPACT (imprinted ancient) family translation regulator